MNLNIPDPLFIENIKMIIDKIRPTVNRLWVVRKKLVVINLSVIILSTICLLIFVKPYFEASIKIVPDFGNKPGLLGSLSDVASIAGLSLQNAPPAEIYQSLIFSEAVLGPVILTKYPIERLKDTVDLIQYFNAPIYNHDPSDIRQRKRFLYAYKWLVEGGITTDVDRVTRILTISVQMSDGPLCAAILNNTAKSLDEYIRTKRKSNASMQLFYIEKRLAQVKDSLATAENRLKNFSLQNIFPNQSPELRLEQSRLSRQVDIQQLIYIELTKQYELTKIEVIRDTPIVNVMEWVQDPVFSPGPSKKLYLAIIMFFSIFFTFGYYGFQSEIHKVFSVIKDSIENR